MAAKAKMKPVVLTPKGRPSVPVAVIRAAVRKVKAERLAKKSEDGKWN